MLNAFAILIFEQDPAEVKEEKRLSPVAVDDANRSKIAMAVLAMATFVQSAGIPKKKRKKLENEIANEVKRMLKGMLKIEKIKCSNCVTIIVVIIVLVIFFFN